MLSSELRNKIIEFAENKITTIELEDWLVPNLPTLIALPTSIDTDIVSAIELGLVEFSSGLRTHDELVEYLLDVLREETITANYPNSMGLTTASSSTGMANQYTNSNTLLSNDINSNIIDWRHLEV